MLSASDEVLREVLALEQAKKTLSVRERAQDDFMVFAKHVYEGFIDIPYTQLTLAVNHSG